VNTDNDFLEREYNPRVQIPQFADFFARWKRSALETRESLRASLDIAYGPASAETLDYFPAAAASAPLLIFIHGGYWRALDKADFSWVAPGFVAAGISVAVLNYGLAPTTPVPEIVAQMRRGCAWLHGNAPGLGVDAQRIFCSGHSAGGHLTGMMLATDWPSLSRSLPKRLLAGALTVSGVFDLQPLTHAEFLRKDLCLDEVGARAISPAFRPRPPRRGTPVGPVPRCCLGANNTEPVLHSSMVFRGFAQNCRLMLRRRNALRQPRQILYNGRLFDGFVRYC